jgi:RNA polymerase sigma-70 factor (ECF subfamily)
MFVSEIYDQYHTKVRRFILTLVRDRWIADDLTQETFVRIQERLDAVKDPSKISAWIFRIAYNLCQDQFRQSKQSINKTGTSRADGRNGDALPLQKELEQRQMGACVQSQLDLLPESLRTVLVLHDTMEFSHKEISEVIGITTENSKVRLHRARKKLRAILEEECTFARDERDVLVCEPVCKSKEETRAG